MKKVVISFLIALFLMITVNQTNALCIGVSKANVRTGPGTSYEIAWEVYQFMPFLKVGQSLSGDWYAVKDLDGDVNWVHKKLVTEKYRCAVVKADKVNVRSGPGTGYSKSPLSPAAQYYSFKVLETESVWVKVQDQWDNIGWIHEDFLWIQ